MVAAEHVQPTYVHILGGWPIAVAVGASYVLSIVSNIEYANAQVYVRASSYPMSKHLDRPTHFMSSCKLWIA